MPEFVKSSVWSPAGTRLALGTTVWPRSAKNSMKRRRISSPDSHLIRGSVAVVLTDIARTVPKAASSVRCSEVEPPKPRGSSPRPRSRRKPWERESPGRYQSSDGRFTINQEGSGRWFVIDEQQFDDLGLARTLGPYDKLEDAKAAADEQRSAPAPESPLAELLASGPKLKVMRGGRAKERRRRSLRRRRARASEAQADVDRSAAGRRRSTGAGVDLGARGARRAQGRSAGEARHRRWTADGRNGGVGSRAESRSARRARGPGAGACGRPAREGGRIRG